jgi:predicted HTH transcriptional regulator
MISKDEIIRLIGCAEGSALEFKSAKGGLPESFWETFSAFANTQGGLIILGVKENNGKFLVDALSEERVNIYKKRFWDNAHNKEKVSATMLTERDVEVVEIGGGFIMIFKVPRASYDIRPVYLTKNSFGNTFKRNHEGDYRCTDIEVRELFSDANHLNMPFDSEILPNYSMDDLDMASLRGYRQRFLLRKENHPWNNLDDFNFLNKIGGYRVDRESGKEGFTRACILMFGKSESITDNVCTPWYFVDYQERLSEDILQRWSDRVYPDGSWEANLFQFFFKVYTKLSNTLPTPFILDNITRVEETSAHIAIREALVNTLVHCSYAEQGNIVILREKDRIIMRNPGRMLISVEDFYVGSHSLCRNPILQKMFMFLGYGEKAGSGADFIVKGWEDNKWGKPELVESVQPDIVTLSLVVESIKDVPQGVPQKENVPQGVPQKENVPQDIKRIIIEQIKLNSKITTEELAEIVGKTSKTVKRYISKIDNVKFVGSGYSGHWEIIDKKWMKK